MKSIPDILDDLLDEQTAHRAQLRLSRLADWQGVLDIAFALTKPVDSLAHRQWTAWRETEKIVVRSRSGNHPALDLRRLPAADKVITITLGYSGQSQASYRIHNAGIPQSLAATDRVDEWRDGQALRVDLEQYH